MATQPLSEAHYRRVAETYLAHGRSTAATARAFGRPRPTVQHWIEGARAAGLIDPRRQDAPFSGSESTIAKTNQTLNRDVKSAPLPPVMGEKPRIRVPASGTLAGNKRVLVISDLHAPYQHPDALRFLAALKEKYDFDRVVCVGDELDYHAMSFHESDPDLDAAGRELQRGREVLWELEAMFPQMDLADSNHGSMVYRRAKAGGVPRHLILDYRDAIFGVKREDGSVVREHGRGDGWRWHQTILLDLPGGQKCQVVHGMSISTRRNVEQVGMCFIQGHHHGTFEIVYNGTPDALNWGMSIGCLIDDHSLAFGYNKFTLKRPVIGCGAIIDGQPRLLPMVLAKGGRWTGFVP